MKCILHTACTALCGAALLAALFGCSRGGEKFTPPDYDMKPEEFSVMTYNLRNFLDIDRDRDGLDDDPKPKRSRQAVYATIQEVHPDILAVQELGSAEKFEAFKDALNKRGLAYEHTEHIQTPFSIHTIAVLSRYPISSRQSHTNDMFTINDKRMGVQRGFIDVDIRVSEEYTFKLMVAHLKSKQYHVMQQTEIRRNEARLLRNHIEDALEKNRKVNLLLVGDMNDTTDSAPVRMIRGEKDDDPRLVDLRPTDFLGDAWTYFTPWDDSYLRSDYVMVSPDMLREVVRERTRAVRSLDWFSASDHRPLVAVFKNVDL